MTWLFWLVFWVMSLFDNEKGFYFSEGEDVHEEDFTAYFDGHLGNTSHPHSVLHLGD